MHGIQITTILKMIKLYHKLKQRSVVINTYHHVKQLKKSLAQVISKFNPLSSKIIGPPKFELKGFHDIHEYLISKQLNDSRYSSWKIIDSAETVNNPTITIGSSTDCFNLTGGTRLSFEFLYAVPNGRVYCQSFFIVTEEDYFLSPVSEYHSTSYRSHPCFSKLKLPKTHKLSGTSIIIRAGIYYHTMIEGLPSLFLLNEAGVSFDEIDHFLVLEIGKGDYINMLSKLGIPENKIIVLNNRTSNYECERLFIPSYTNRAGLWYKKYLIQHYFDKKLVADTCAKRIYVSRSNCKTRRIINESEVMDVLSPLGFIKVNNEDLSVPMQMGLFKNATHIISPHGSNLVNVIFCDSGVRVCEIRHCQQSNIYNGTYHELTNYVNGNYYLLLCSRGVPMLSTDGKKDWGNGDLHVDISDLKAMLIAMHL